jgi:hypothetical protein
MQNYQTWLETNTKPRVLLAQISCLYNGTLTTKYVATHAVTVDSTEYLALIRGGLDISESISTEYSATINYGDLDLVNNTGDLDSWLSSNYIWVNKPIKVYVGSLPDVGVTSAIGDFELVFEGVVNDIDSKGRNSINFKLRDKLENLNLSISEALLGNYKNGTVEANPVTPNQNVNTLKPLCFGEVLNISPVLADGSNLHYMVHNTEVESIIEVRDNGKPVLFTPVTTTEGAVFKLNASPVGTITCSVQGSKRTVNTTTGAVSAEYLNTASNIILTILREYGKTIAAADIELNSFTALGSQAIGLYITDRANVLQTVQGIAKSCGLIVSVTRTGKVKLLDLAIPASSTVSIYEEDTLYNTFAISRKIDVVAAVKLGYAKTWTTQTNIQTGIPEAHKDIYAKEYDEALSFNGTVQLNYNITKEPELEGTYLIDKTEAEAVSAKKLALLSTPRKVIKMTCTTKYLSVQVGDKVSLVNFSRFNLQANALGLVVSTKPDWVRGTIEIEVLV